MQCRRRADHELAAVLAFHQRRRQLLTASGHVVDRLLNRCYCLASGWGAAGEPWKFNAQTDVVTGLG